MGRLFTKSKAQRRKRKEHEMNTSFVSATSVNISRAELQTCAEMHMDLPRRHILVKRSHKPSENPFLDSRIVICAHIRRNYCWLFANFLRERSVNGRKINCK